MKKLLTLALALVLLLSGTATVVASELDSADVDVVFTVEKYAVIEGLEDARVEWSFDRPGAAIPDEQLPFVLKTNTSIRLRIDEDPFYWLFHNDRDYRDLLKPYLTITHYTEHGFHVAIRYNWEDPIRNILSRDYEDHGSYKFDLRIGAKWDEAVEEWYDFPADTLRGTITITVEALEVSVK